MFEGKAGCSDLPWGARVHLHKPRKRWMIKPVPGTSCFSVLDSEKPSSCLRYLSASPDCSELYLNLAAKDDGSGLQRWRLIPDR